MLHTASGSNSLVADRDETKYLIRNGAARHLADGLRDRLPMLSPPSGARITCVYFDTPAREILGVASSNSRSIKVRVKEYADRQDPDEVWLELKLREGHRTGKLRVATDRDEVLAAIASPARGDGALFDELTRLGSTLEGTLAPACTVSYRRLAWETEDERIRVTIDTRIRYADAPPPPWGERSLASLLPPPVGAFDGGILELKLRVPPPEWLRGLVGGMGLQSSPFSKFVAGSRSLLAA